MKSQYGIFWKINGSPLFDLIPCFHCLVFKKNFLSWFWFFNKANSCFGQFDGIIQPSNISLYVFLRILLLIDFFLKRAPNFIGFVRQKIDYSHTIVSRQKFCAANDLSDQSFIKYCQVYYVVRNKKAGTILKNFNFLSF